jgi:hypothetical protein
MALTLAVTGWTPSQCGGAGPDWHAVYFAPAAHHPRQGETKKVRELFVDHGDVEIIKGHTGFGKLLEDA